MGIIFPLMMILTIGLTQAAPPELFKKYDGPSLTEPSESEETKNHSEPPPLSLNLELPREEPAPKFYYDYPPPSEDLELPSTEPWNPNNDPKYYYELPSIITKQATVTNSFPKKYDKELHEKLKPTNGKPKQEITLVAISQEDYLMKQKAAEKLLLNLAKNQAKAENKVHNLKDDNEPQASTSNHGFAPFNDNRVEFQMHGYDGPLSYKWGYDTGKGNNRQFRYEERDKHGFVKGHYGYLDKNGKLRMVHYDAHPEDGFHAEENTGN